ncbi:hypothetical protein L3073_06070 [Ancylomarina sp. DW003]|nr:hypothetical protein [Ancylomarina sp. DW003]MDE5421767.1 hypothetical protein [Ancylomarina sp. DW003]
MNKVEYNLIGKLVREGSPTKVNAYILELSGNKYLIDPSTGEVTDRYDCSDGNICYGFSLKEEKHVNGLKISISYDFRLAYANDPLLDHFQEK